MGLHTKVRYVIDLKSPNRQGQVDEIIQFATRLYDFIFDYMRQNEHASLVLTQKCTAQCQQVSRNKDAIIIILQIGSVLPNKTMPNYRTPIKEKTQRPSKEIINYRQICKKTTNNQPKHFYIK